MFQLEPPMRNASVDEWLVNAVVMYEGAQVADKTAEYAGYSMAFDVKVRQFY